MLCHRRLIYSCCAFCAFLFTSCFFLSPSYATSHSFSYNFDDMPGQEVVDSSVLGFTPVYVEVELTGSSYANSYFAIGKVFYDSTSSYNIYCYSDSTGYCHFITFLPVGKYQRNGKWSYSNSPGFTSLTITYFDSNPVVPCDCPEPDPCPEVPENPYDDKLDSLIKAVYFVPAVLLAIYFFYIMYSWYIRS